MNVSILDLPAEIVASYEANARARGVSLDAFVRDYLINNAPPAPMKPSWTRRSGRRNWMRYSTVSLAVGLLLDEAFSRRASILVKTSGRWTVWSIPT